ncbi:site-specific integrase [Mesorhizobium sp. M7A.F.Ca.MR.245.00.0.0]|uniref:tyrosine-type recombinase/integrase n=1 Tax=Mesorhizobium sp. M7A.F.Ca.MR.245.00.0.0 TaxID=2496778 RepID=UPI000FCB2BB2|nr:site-specific integrase [Mesorhizobium sp. M7A.F.Ca.MR.245.00.0.0]RUV16911.1 integrase [Mesorhizobium sp. M7A.F.Ca.MR.245.00.0.0]RUV52828.1 integrase [Mesorhizobium sp. M7A.F.Ca.MR.228.00.0.0]
MQIDLPYVQQPSGKKHYRYRRKVPAFLRQALGKTEIILPLGRTPAEVLRHYDKVHKQAEAELKGAMKGQPKQPGQKTELERYQWATRHVAEWNALGPMSDEAADALADHLEETGQGDLYRALVVPDRKPEPTLADAVKLYLKDKVEGTPDETKKRQRVERVKGHVEKALSRGDPQIRSLTRTDAREVRDHMLADGDMSPATVHRYLNDLRAIITHAIKELDLRGAVNPFNGLEVKRETLAKEDRKPFTEGQLKAARARVLGHASEDLQRIWRMLEQTGCRLAEVTGLMVEDVHLDGESTYLDLRFHPHRRLKNAGSVRRVPLVEDALKAAQEAHEAAGDRTLLFPTYAREGGATAASQVLMKHVRKVVSDPKVTVHSLRHTLKDRLVRADVPEAVQNMILGHSSGAVSEAYGGPEARLEVATKALRKALGKT